MTIQEAKDAGVLYARPRWGQYFFYVAKSDSPTGVWCVGSCPDTDQTHRELVLLGVSIEEPR